MMRRPLLAGGLAQLGGQLLGELIEVELGQQLLDRLRAHTGAEIVLVLSRISRYSASVRICFFISGVSPGSMTI